MKNSSIYKIKKNKENQNKKKLLHKKQTLINSNLVLR